MNIWKWVSIILIMLNITFFSWLYIALDGDYNNPSVDSESSSYNEDEAYAILPNATMEMLINEYLETSNIDVSITTENITLSSTDEVLGMTVNTTFNLTPIIEKDRIIFQVSDIDIGDLPLSQNHLYSIIVNASELPEGVQFGDNEQSLIIDTEIFEEEFKEQIQIQTIDYENDEWYFSIER